MCFSFIRVECVFHSFVPHLYKKLTGLKSWEKQFNQKYSINIWMHLIVNQIEVFFFCGPGEESTNEHKEEGDLTGLL